MLKCIKCIINLRKSKNALIHSWKLCKLNFVQFSNINIWKLFWFEICSHFKDLPIWKMYRFKNYLKLKTVLVRKIFRFKTCSNFKKDWIEEFDFFAFEQFSVENRKKNKKNPAKNRKRTKTITKSWKSYRKERKTYRRLVSPSRAMRACSFCMQLACNTTC
jgi:hypothetical protein